MLFVVHNCCSTCITLIRHLAVPWFSNGGNSDKAINSKYTECKCFSPTTFADYLIIYIMHYPLEHSIHYVTTRYCDIHTAVYRNIGPVIQYANCCRFVVLYQLLQLSSSSSSSLYLYSLACHLNSMLTNQVLGPSNYFEAPVHISLVFFPSHRISFRFYFCLPIDTSFVFVLLLFFFRSLECLQKATSNNNHPPASTHS